MCGEARQEKSPHVMTRKALGDDPGRRSKAMDDGAKL
jgi:hypothetical protein